MANIVGLMQIQSEKRKQITPKINGSVYLLSKNLEDGQRVLISPRKPRKADLPEVTMEKESKLARPLNSSNKSLKLMFLILFIFCATVFFPVPSFPGNEPAPQNDGRPNVVKKMKEFIKTGRASSDKSITLMQVFDKAGSNGDSRKMYIEPVTPKNGTGFGLGFRIEF